jgi:hypothetical protein
MKDDNSIKISGSVEGIFMPNGKVGKDVTNIINKQSTTNEKSDNSEIKKLLEQLKTAIKNEPSLDEKNKAKALKQVEELDKAAATTNNEEKQEKADNAITMLKGIFSGLATGVTLIDVWDKLISPLSKLFGIG